MKRLRSIPGTIVVCAIVVGYGIYLESRNVMIRAVRRLRKIKEQ